MTSNQLATFGTVSSVAVRAAANASSELSGGVSSGYGVIGFRGKTWRVKHKGTETDILNERGEPQFSIEVILVKSAGHLSKIWYEQGYVEGSNAAPDCFSINGMRPDAASPKPQHPTCATCPKNQWGSRITPAGKKGKACSDSRRVALVSAADIDNNRWGGGALLMRVPAASLNDLAAYGNKMQAAGFPYFAIVTRISFDTSVAYPKLVFNAVRALTDAEAQKIVSLRDSDLVTTMLEEEVSEVTTGGVDDTDPAPLFEQPPAPAQEAAPVAQEVAPAAPAPKPAPVVTKPTVSAPPRVQPPVKQPEPEPEPVVEVQPEPEVVDADFTEVVQEDIALTEEGGEEGGDDMSWLGEVVPAATIDAAPEPEPEPVVEAQPEPAPKADKPKAEPKPEAPVKDSTKSFDDMLDGLI